MPKGKEKAHVGFKGAVESVEKKEGYSKERAEKIIAAGARNASAKAKKENPRLKRVKAAKKKG